MGKWIVMIIALPVLKLIAMVIHVRETRLQLWRRVTGRQPHHDDLVAAHH